jgi:hypothetical protein
MFDLDPLTGITIPPIFLPYVHIHFGGSWVDGVGRIMGFVHDYLPEISFLGYTNPILMPQHSLIVYSEARRFVFSSLLTDLH